MYHAKCAKAISAREVLFCKGGVGRCLLLRFWLLLLFLPSVVQAQGSCWSEYCGQPHPGTVPSGLTVKSDSCQFNTDEAFWFFGGSPPPSCEATLYQIPLGVDATLQYRHYGDYGGGQNCYDHINFWYRVVGDATGWHFVATRYKGQAIFDASYLTVYEFQIHSSDFNPGDTIQIGADFVLPDWMNCSSVFLPYYRLTVSGQPIGWAAGGIGTILNSADSGETWQAQVSNSSANLNSICFADDSLGWVAGGQVVLKTTNGGQTWVDKYQGGGNLNSVFFSDKLQGCAVGTTGRIELSTNGGESWNQVSSETSADLTSVFFINKHVGWAAGGQVILKTTDGGHSWVNKYFGGGALSSIHFNRSGLGCAVGTTGRIARSTNWGETWVEVSSNSSADLMSVYFTSDSIGYVAGGQVILKSTDGGANWVDKYDGGGALGSIAFIDEFQGWAVGSTGIIERTTDAGETWVAKESGTSSPLQSVCFVVKGGAANTPVSTRGDIDGDGKITISDAVSIVNWIFGIFPSSDPDPNADVDCSGRVDITDAVFLINYIFAGGPAPC